MAEESGELGVTFRRLDNGIYEFVFRDADKQTVDFFFYALEDILRLTKPDDLNRYVLDVSNSGRDISLVPMIQRFRKLEQLLPNRARGRTAVLHNPALTYTFLDGLVRALAPGRDLTRFFPVEKRDKAIEWLLSET